MPITESRACGSLWRSSKDLGLLLFGREDVIRAAIPATYRRLGLEQQYVRQRGFERLQQDQFVLQYVAAHGRIARRDAAELFKVHPKQASRILARLTRRGDLVMHGKKRSAWYGLPEDGDTKL